MAVCTLPLTLSPSLSHSHTLLRRERRKLELGDAPVRDKDTSEEGLDEEGQKKIFMAEHMFRTSSELSLGLLELQHHSRVHQDAQELMLSGMTKNFPNFIGILVYHFFSMHIKALTTFSNNLETICCS